MRRVIRLVLAVSAACGSVIVVAPAAAQSPKSVQIVHTSRRAFNLPVKLEERDRSELRELKFYVKPLQGNRPGEWVCLETAAPQKTKFSYQAPQDGEYWFAFVTIDQAGRVAPSDLERTPPGLIVIVDTRAPEVDVRRVVSGAGETYLQCQIRDANPDYAVLKLESFSADRGWRPLEPMADNPGMFRVPEASLLRNAVRVSAADKAGNRTVREIDLAEESTTLVESPSARTVAQTTSRAALQAVPASAVGAAPGMNVAMVPPAAPPMPQPQQPPHQAAVEDFPRPMPTPEAPRRPEMPSRMPERVAERSPSMKQASVNRQLINNPHCMLDYSYEALNVTKVEAYATRDGGRSWMRLGEDEDRRSPFEFDLPGDGIYGVTLVLSTASQPGKPPAAGDTPDSIIEVDSTPPVVQMNDLRLGHNEDNPQILFSWSVQDRNLGNEPVALYWASQPEGPWNTAISGMKSEGVSRWNLPKDVGGKLYLRLEAIDRAGNLGRWETREGLTVEQFRPKARVLGVTTSQRK